MTSNEKSVTHYHKTSTYPSPITTESIVFRDSIHPPMAPFQSTCLAVSPQGKLEIFSTNGWVNHTIASKFIAAWGKPSRLFFKASFCTTTKTLILFLFGQLFLHLYKYLLYIYFPQNIMSQSTTILLKTTNKILLIGDVPKMSYMSLFLLEPPQSHHQPVDETRGDFLKIIELSLNGLQALAFSSTPWK